MDGDEQFVTWGRWQAEHARLGDRISYLEEKCEEIETTTRHRADRYWQILLAFLTGLALPLAVILLTTHG